MNLCVRLLGLLALAVVCVLPVRAEETKLYVVGGFQGWDIDAPQEFDYVDGVYTLDIDFSRDKFFKISTTKGSWTDFDKCALQPVAPIQLNKTMDLEKGIANIEAPAQSILKVIVNLESMTIVISDGGSPDTPWSGTLPLLVVNTDGGAPIVSKEDYLHATCYLDPLGLEGVTAIGSADEPVELQIRGRGNYTWIGFDKKPYRLKFTSKQAPLGMKKSKHFVLLAHADDPYGFLRNEVGFELSRLIGMPWTPASKPVEVVLNGDYIGLYFLTENIRVDKDRVDIVEQPDLATSPEEITGGWLVEIDNYDSDPHVSIPEYGDHVTWFTYKTPEELSSQQENWLTNNLTEVNRRIYYDSTDNPTWGEMIDMERLAKFYIIQEITDNRESFHGSCYLNRQQGDATKWMFGPVWDFGNSFSSSNKQFIWHSGFHQVWIRRMCEFPQFMEIVKNEWKSFMGENRDRIFDHIDAFAASIATAARYNARRWPQYGNSDEQSAKRRYVNLLNGSINFLTEEWGDPSSVESPGIASQSAVACVSASRGVLTVVACSACEVQVVSIDGYVRTLTLSEGVNTFTDLPAGFYIVAGRKVIL